MSIEQNEYTTNNLVKKTQIRLIQIMSPGFLEQWLPT